MNEVSAGGEREGGKKELLNNARHNRFAAVAADAAKICASKLHRDLR